MGKQAVRRGLVSTGQSFVAWLDGSSTGGVRVKHYRRQERRLRRVNRADGLGRAERDGGRVREHGRPTDLAVGVYSYLNGNG